VSVVLPEAGGWCTGAGHLSASGAAGRVVGFLFVTVAEGNGAQKWSRSLRLRDERRFHVQPAPLC
jgi:hypothetical protein